jgi:hypothetical protein
MREKTISMLFACLMFLPSMVFSYTTDLQATLSSEEVKPGEEITITLSITEETDAYFFSVEVGFDSGAFDFIGIENVGLTAGGLKIADLINHNSVGASVTRTSPLTEPAAGDLMEITFRSKIKSPAGMMSFTFSEIQLADSNDELIETNPVDPVEAEVLEAITILSLNTPSTIEVEEGDEFFAAVSVFANGVTDDPANEGRLQVWIGVSESNIDPAGWDEGVWQLMTFSSVDDDTFIYEEEVAFQRPLGNSYLAVRAELDTDPEMKYAGVGGFWDSVTNPSAIMTIQQQPPFRYTLAAWDFDDETLVASEALPQNTGTEIEVIGANSISYAAGATGRAASASGWSDFDPDNPKYWLLTVSTENMSSIQVSSKQYGTSAGPRDFSLQLSLDGIIWDDVSGGSIVVETNFTTGVLDQLTLPAFVENQEEVFIRWLQTSDIRVDGNLGVTTGTNRIDDILITGINPDAERTEVWAGDTNNDGSVNEEDVLPLAIYWGIRGPNAVYSSTTWEPRPAEEWIPPSATYADANGDGRIDQNDLRPVGINFGETRSVEKLPEKITPIAALTLDRLNYGEEISFYLISDREHSLSGISFNLTVDGIEQAAWQLGSIETLEWSEGWAGENRMIEFTVNSGNQVSAAFAHKGIVEPEYSSVFVHVTIRAAADWSDHPTVTLNRISLVDGSETYEPKNMTLSLERDAEVKDPFTELPESTLLLQNYPNPFNPTTQIEYTLSEPGNVRIDVYNTLGRRVATILNESRPAGEYTLQFDGSNLSSGIYFYRMETPGYTKTRSMALIK